LSSRLPLVAVLAALLLFASIGVAFADDTTYLSVDALPPRALSGAPTFTGIAVNCTSGQPATRVAVYDGENSSSPYIADVSMDTVRDVSSACAPNNVAGQALTGFTLIYDTNKLRNGSHSLTFVASFAGGASNSTTIQVAISNGAPVAIETPSVAVLTPFGVREVSPIVGGYDYVSPNTYVAPYVAPYVATPFYNGAAGYYNGMNQYYYNGANPYYYNGANPYYYNGAAGYYNGVNSYYYNGANPYYYNGANPYYYNGVNPYYGYNYSGYGGYRCGTPLYGAYVAVVC
jgi:hypothetical protein